MTVVSTRHLIPRVAAAGLAGLVVACGGGGETPPDGRPHGDAGPGANALFDPPTPGGGADWGAIPYPSDLFLDVSGHLTLNTLPTGPEPNQTQVQSLREALHSLGGAGVRSNVYFPVAGTVDPATAEAGASLIDLDASQAGSLVAVDADVLWRQDLSTLVLAPKVGVVFRGNHRYAAYLTSAIHGSDGTAMTASAAFAAAIDGDDDSDPATAAAAENLAPLLAVLPADVKAQLVSATVFRTDDVTAVAQKMRDVVDANTPTITSIDSIYGPGETGATGLEYQFGHQTADAIPGSDNNNPRPQPHSHVALVVHGTVNLPSFVTDTPGVNGWPEFEPDGTPKIKGTEAVKFTLTLPRGTPDWDNLPVVVYVHGFLRTRQDLMTQADTAAARGIALLGIDLAYHGSRTVGGADSRNDLIGTNGPDGFGDSIDLVPALGYFHLNPSGGIAASHPQVMGENMRQSSMDLVAMVELIADGNWSRLNTELAGLGAGLPTRVTFRNDVGLLTESLGGLLTGCALAVEPRLAVAYQSAPAPGFPFPSMVHSPNYSAQFLGVLTNPLDIEDRIVMFDPLMDARFDPIVMLNDNAMERGDALAYAPYILDGSLRGGARPDLVVSMHWGDVYVSNDTQEGYAKALGLAYVPFPAAPMQPPQAPRYVTLDRTPPPVTRNNGGRTAAFVVFHPAGHRALRSVREERNYDQTYPPFVPANPPVMIPDQTVQIHEVWGGLMADHFAGTAPTIRDPYAN